MKQEQNTTAELNTGLLNTQKNAEETTQSRVNYSCDKILEWERIEETPFTILRHTERKQSALTIGTTLS